MMSAYQQHRKQQVVGSFQGLVSDPIGVNGGGGYQLCVPALHL